MSIDDHRPTARTTRLIPAHDEAFFRSFATWGATKMPRWFLRLSPALIGIGIGAAQPRIRKQLRENLRLIHGLRSTAVEVSDVASTLANFAHCFAEGLAASGPHPPVFRYEVQGRENLIAARDAGRGAILVTAHMGSFDVAAAVMNLSGFELAIAMAAERDEGARAMSDAGRARVGVKVFHVGDDPLAALPLVQHIRKGGAVALQIDRVPEKMRAHRASLFGRPWDVPLGPFQLAQVTGAPIVPVFTARVGFLQHLVCARPWIRLPRRATSADLDGAIGRAIDEAETFIRKFPTQWFHFAPYRPLLLDESRSDAAHRESA